MIGDHSRSFRVVTIRILGCDPFLVCSFEELFFRLRFPVFWDRIPIVDGLVKLSSDSADRFRFSDVGIAKVARGQPANMVPRFDQDDAFAHACHLHCRDDPSTRAAVDNDTLVCFCC